MSVSSDEPGERIYALCHVVLYVMWCFAADVEASILLYPALVGTPESAIVRSKLDEGHTYLQEGICVLGA